MDVVVNAALLTALLGWKRGTAATLLLGLILSTNSLWEREDRQARSEAAGEPGAADRRAYTPPLAGQVAANLGLSTRLLALGAALRAVRWTSHSRPRPARVSLSS